MLDALELIRSELDHAYKKHGRDFWGRHEFYGILKEEVDELWDAIKGDHPIDRVLAEAVQVAAVCVRYLETGDRYRGEHHHPMCSRSDRCGGRCLDTLGNSQETNPEP